jgi:RHS repeat-associated protein
VVISDRKKSIDIASDGTTDYYLSEVKSYTDFYAFGSVKPGRVYQAEQYRYSLNGQEREHEITGSPSHSSAEYWMYDSRIARRWEIDPVFKNHESPYATFHNNPITFQDPNGADPVKRFSFGKRVKNFLSGKHHQNRANKDAFENGIDESQVKYGEKESYVEIWRLVAQVSNQNHENSPVVEAEWVIEIKPYKNRGKSSLWKNLRDKEPSWGNILNGWEKAAKKYLDFTKKEHLKGRNKAINTFSKRVSDTFKDFGIKVKPSTISNGWKNISKSIAKPFAEKSFKYVPLVGKLMDGKEFIEAWEKDGGAWGKNTTVQVAGIAGSTFGTTTGTYLGAEIGTLICPGIGTVIGALVGGIFGSFIGEESAEYAADELTPEN